MVLGAQFRFSYPYFMVIDGNDDRGIDVGIMSRFPITNIQSHVHDKNNKGVPIFSRDCPEFDITLPSGDVLGVLPNHFKSKRNGDDQESKDRRKLQAKTAHDYAVKAKTRSPYVLVGGDLNDTPDSTSLSPLFTEGFQDIMSHPSYPQDRPGTYATETKTDKIDYLIMSPKLRTKLNLTGIERRGSYHPRTWISFDTVTKPADEASAHHLIWADFKFENGTHPSLISKGATPGSQSQ